MYFWLVCSEHCWLALQPTGLALRTAWLALRAACLTLRAAWLALSPALLALKLAWLVLERMSDQTNQPIDALIEMVEGCKSVKQDWYQLR